MSPHCASTPGEATRLQLPLPPTELRRLVCHDDSGFDISPDGGPAFPYIADPSLYSSVFDFGCGCGRVARQLLHQEGRPKRYVGIDIHRGMVQWCQENLSTIDPAFQFYHHDVWNVGLAPENTRQATAEFPVGSGEFTLVNAHSVFTHLNKDQTEFYLGEVSRILADRGVARTTWFLFDRATFPMMFDFQVALFINDVDPSNAVIFDWRWLLGRMDKCGLQVVHTVSPAQRGFQWELYLRKAAGGSSHAFPLDAYNLQSLCGSGTSAERRPVPAEQTSERPQQTDRQLVPTLPSVR